MYFSAGADGRISYGHLGSTNLLKIVFRLDALALSVIATAAWLGGWLGGWVAVCHSGIVSKRLNISENFLEHLVGPSFKHLRPLTPIPNSTGNPFIGGVKYKGVGKLAIFVRFLTYIAVYLETVRDRPMVTMER